MYPVKILLTPVLLLFVLSLHAQYHALTVIGGLNVANMSSSVDGANVEDTYNMKMAFHGGFLFDYVYSKDRQKELSIEPGLLFDAKGVKQELSIGENTQENAWNLYYIDIPVYFKYSKKLRSRDKIYGGIGPYIGAGIFGKYEKSFDIEGIEGDSSESIKWGSDASEHHFKRLDYGVSARIGYYSDGGLNLSASYDFGIPNITTADNLPEFKHRLIRVSLGYSFRFED